MNDLESCIKKLLDKEYPELFLKFDIDKRLIVNISGECRSWQQLIDVGHKVANVAGVHNVVSDMTVKGINVPSKNYSAEKAVGLSQGIIKNTDIVVVGAGVIGCGIARELSKYNLNIVVVEGKDDVCTGASKANNGNIHPGHAVNRDTLKAKLNILGNRMYDKWAEELGFRFQRNGLMYVAQEKKYIAALKERYKKGLENGVDGIEFIDSKRCQEMEPELKKLKPLPVAAVWLPSLAHVEPYEVTIALAENAACNGVEFLFNTLVCDVIHSGGVVNGVVTSKGTIKAKKVINCAGVYADDVSQMAGDRSFTIHPRKGTIAILDKAKQYPYKAQLGFVGHSLEDRMRKIKNSESKGGGCCKTPEGNYLLGPSAKEVWDKEDTSTEIDQLNYAMSCNQHKNVGRKDLIRAFTGVRAADFKEDFIIEMSPVTEGFINVAGIQSPGLASAPAIAEMVEDILLKAYEKQGEPLKKRKNYNPIRKARKPFRDMTCEEKKKIIRKHPEYGKIICRCERITEGEILEVLKSPLVPGSVEAIKKRTRAGMGRCQGGFCQPRVVEILAREHKKDWDAIIFTEKGTNILKKMS